MQKFRQWLASKHFLADDYLEKAEKRPYKLFQIESSLKCGLSCVMCPWSGLRASAGVMAWATFERIADNFHLTESVDLTGGGEPLTNPAIPDMVWKAKGAGCEVGFSTNGVHLTPDLAEKLVCLELDWISFSVDAADAEAYNRIRQGADFNIVIENIKRLGEIKRRLGTQMPRMMMVFVMMAGEYENYQQLPAFIELCSQLGIEYVVAKNLDVIVKEGDDERRLFSHDGPPAQQVQAVMETARQRAKALGVGLRFYELQPVEQAICEHNPVQVLFFNWDGKVSPCITLSYAGQRYFNGAQVEAPCLHFGNIREQELAEIWNQPDYCSFRQLFTARIRWEQRSVLDMMLDGNLTEFSELTPAPPSCQTCYYLYGV